MTILKFLKPRKRRSSRSKKKAQSRRFYRTVLLSALISFAVTTWLINPTLFKGGQNGAATFTTSLGERLSQIKLDKLDVGAVTEWLPDIDQLNPIQWVSSALSQDQQIGLQSPPASVNGYQQTSFSQCPQFFPARHLPIVPAADGLSELCFTPFAILHSGQTKTPVFVAQRLNRQMLLDAKAISRADRFYEEARLPRAHRSALSDYQGSGFDRGHMAPAGDMHNEEAMAQSFSLANIVPQNAQHNRGAWSKIEADTRKYVSRAQGDVYIFTGPVYEERPETIGERKVAIPKYLYKLVYDETTGKAWVHWHENSADTRVGAPISYAEFVQRTGLHLLDPELLK